MRYYLEETSDAYKSYTWLSDNLAPHWRNSIPPIESFGIVGERLFTLSDINLFKKKCDDLLLRHFMKNHGEANYKFLLLGLESNESKKSEKMFNYFKVWKELEKEFDLSNFTLRIEVPLQIDDELCYIGLSEFDLNSLPTVTEIMRKYPKTYCIIYKEVKSEDSTENLISILMENGFSKLPIIDFPNLIPTLALNHYSICLWKFYSIEEEVCCFYSKNE